MSEIHELESALGTCDCKAESWELMNELLPLYRRRIIELELDADCARLESKE